MNIKIFYSCLLTEKEHKFIKFRHTRKEEKLKIHSNILLIYNLWH